MRCIKSKVLIASLAVAFVGTAGLSVRCFAQSGEQAADQTVFQDDAELMRLNNAQVNQLEAQEANAEAQANLDRQRNQAYRLYAEKRVQDLEKLKGKNSSTQEQIAVLQRWLKADAAMRLTDMQTIKSLRERVARMEQTQQQVTTNLGGDVGAMREAGENARSDDKFRQMMAVNYFNEMQTEMGPASWYPPRGGGANYSMGGMGFNGGQQLFGGY